MKAHFNACLVVAAIFLLMCRVALGSGATPIHNGVVQSGDTLTIFGTITLGAGGNAVNFPSGGSVNSVSVTAPSIFTVSGGPITNTGTITISLANSINGANGLVELTGAGYLPVLNGSLLTNIPYGALTGTPSIPTNVSQLTNDAGYITVGGAPVQSVNGQTGTVTLSIQPPITLTTTGSSGPATFIGNVLNVPQYAGVTYGAGTGLTLTGSTFSVTASAYDAFGAAATAQSNAETFSANAGNISSGTLAVAHGGTGATTPLGAAQNLGVNFSNVLSESSSFTASQQGTLYEVTTGTNVINVTLPTPVSGFTCAIRKADSASGIVAVNGSALGIGGHMEEIFCDGTNYYNRFVGGSMDSTSGFTLSTGGTVSDITLQPENNFMAPHPVQRVGPASGIFAFLGTSLTAGTGSSPSTPVNWYGVPFSYPGQLQTMSFCQNMTVWNYGVSGYTVANMTSQYKNGGVDTTATTAGTATVTLASGSGVVNGYEVTAKDIAPGTTVVSGGGTTTIVLSAAATGTNTGEAVAFAAAPAIAGNLWATTGPTAHQISPAILGLSNEFLSIDGGANDVYVGGITATGTATTGNATISSMSVTTGSSVGGASLSATTGYSAWGGTGTGSGVYFTYLGTVSSATSSSTTLSSGSAVNSSMTTFKYAPPLSTLEASVTSLVAEVVTDGWITSIQSQIPLFYASAGYNQAQYLENESLFNAWEKGTFSDGAYSSSVTFIDSASNQELQASGAQYHNLTDYPHLNNAGYLQWAGLFNQQCTRQYASYCTTLNSWYSRNGIPESQLPSTILRLDLTGTQTMVGSLALAGNNLSGVGNLTGSNAGAISGFTQGVFNRSVNNQLEAESNAAGGQDGGVFISGTSGFANFADWGTFDPSSTVWGANLSGNSGVYLGVAGHDFVIAGVANSDSLHYTQSNGNLSVSGALAATGSQTLATSSTGTATFFQPANGPGYKHVGFWVNGTGTFTCVFGTPFVNAPSANQINLPSGVTATVGTGTAVLVGVAASGGGSIDGF